MDRLLVFMRWTENKVALDPDDHEFSIMHWLGVFFPFSQLYLIGPHVFSTSS